MSSTVETFGHFFQETQDDLIRFFLRRLHCRDTAADLAQETYLRLHVCEQQAPTQNRRALAFSIARNLAVDHIRKERLRSRYVTDQLETAAELDSLSCSKQDSERKAIVWQELEHIQIALAELPEESRTALYLSAVEGLTYAQIGKCLGVSERMVAKRIAKTLKHCHARRNEH